MITLEKYKIEINKIILNKITINNKRTSWNTIRNYFSQRQYSYIKFANNIELY